jgi:hypothetical protein
MAVTMKSTIFWDVMASILAQLTVCLAYSSDLKTVAERASKTSVNFYWTTWNNTPEDSTLQLFTKCNFILLPVNHAVSQIYQIWCWVYDC